LRKEVTEPLGIRHLVLVCWYGDRVSVGGDGEAGVEGARVCVGKHYWWVVGGVSATMAVKIYNICDLIIADVCGD